MDRPSAKFCHWLIQALYRLVSVSRLNDISTVLSRLISKRVPSRLEEAVRGLVCDVFIF